MVFPMENTIKVICYGVGVIGSKIARTILEKKGISIVGAIDIAKDKVRKDLGEVLGLDKELGVTITDDPEELFSNVEADIVVHCTSSYLPKVYPQIVQCVKAELNVISTCEELSFPFDKYPELASRIDKLAIDYGVTVLGTGINPGYLMDTLPIILTAPCLSVEYIEVTRMMNSAKRRIPFQEKIGTGLTKEEFMEKMKNKVITGHVGLYESISMIAAALGWKLDKIEELDPEPVLADKDLETPYTKVPRGYVAGLKSIAKGYMNGKEVIVLNFVAYAHAPEEYDEIIIRGEPNIHQKIIGGVHGDTGTVAMVVNAIPKVLNARPGLLTMKEISIPSAAVEDMRIYVA
ncbi:MAG TPA: hypothetical protein EYP68_00380 [Candidatus Korarchaeota archaeon]|nr:hypothetical protein [Candidatus Korarchaeota archaeon]